MPSATLVTVPALAILGCLQVPRTPHCSTSMPLWRLCTCVRYPSPRSPPGGCYRNPLTFHRGQWSRLVIQSCWSWSQCCRGSTPGFSPSGCVIGSHTLRLSCRVEMRKAPRCAIAVRMNQDTEAPVLVLSAWKVITACWPFVMWEGSCPPSSPMPTAL